MAVAIIGDTHMPRGARRLPERCTELLAGAELIVHTGDLTAASVLDEIESIGPPVVAVLGNVDEPALRDRLPETATFEPAAGLQVAVIHDAGPRRGRIERVRLRFPGADAVLFGHSHIPLHERTPDGFQIFNPGSPTERRRAPQRTMGLLEAPAGRLEFRHVEL